MAPQFDLRTFMARSPGEEFDATTLAKVLAPLPGLSSAGPWLAGGALRRSLLGQEPDSDFDFFFRDADQLSEFRLAVESLGLSLVRETEHHIHFRGVIPGAGALLKDVQLIRFAFYADAAAVIDSFDFTICQFAFDGVLLHCGTFSLWDLGRKRLAINKITYPVSTMRRLLKYGQQGFTACGGCLTQVLRETASKPELMSALGIEYVD